MLNSKVPKRDHRQITEKTNHPLLHLQTKIVIQKLDSLEVVIKISKLRSNSSISIELQRYFKIVMMNRRKPKMIKKMNKKNRKL